MKICIPTAKDEGIDSLAYGHFGSAPFFIMYDIATKELYSVSNVHKNTEHGNYRPGDIMKEHNVTAVVVGGIGMSAYQNLLKNGIKIFRTSDFFHIYEIIDQFSNDLMFEMHPQDVHS